MCGVKGRRPRSFSVMEGREVHVISGPGAHLGEQRAVDPVDDRSIHFTGSPEHPAVVVEFRDENVLHLQIPTRMKQRHRVDKTFQRSGAKVESQIYNSFAYKFLEQGRLDSRGKRRIKDTLNRNQSFFKADRIPYRSPERNSLLDVRVLQMLRTDFKQPVHRSNEVRG